MMFFLNNILPYLLNFSIFLALFIFLLLTIALTTLLERKMMGSVQRRRGPNIAGLFGFLQPIADGLKLFLKEIIIPTNANLFLYLIAPVFTLFSSILLWLVIPFNSVVVLLDTPYSMLFLLAISSLAVYGIIFSGWASNSKYAFLGGLRSSAQMISYEVCISFVWLIISLLGESLNICDIIKKQDESIWFVVPLFPLWIIFFIIALAETNRAPFDLPEAEAELVAGYNVEYSSIAFALFFLGEYANMALMSALCTIFFWGGWLPLFSVMTFPYIWFGLKVTFHLIGFIWVRATLPRYRYDQLMKLGWKKLMPLTIIFVLFSVIVLFFIKTYIVILSTNSRFVDMNMFYLYFLKISLFFSIFLLFSSFSEILIIIKNKCIYWYKDSQKKFKKVNIFKPFSNSNNEDYSSWTFYFIKLITYLFLWFGVYLFSFYIISPILFSFVSIFMFQISLILFLCLYLFYLTYGNFKFFLITGLGGILCYLFSFYIVSPFLFSFISSFFFVHFFVYILFLYSFFYYFYRDPQVIEMLNLQLSRLYSKIEWIIKILKKYIDSFK